MIRGIRARIVAGTGALTPVKSWLDAAQTATARALLEGAVHKIDDDIYAHLEVRKVLEKLFEQKCAYCESKIGINADWDVEHYRPKGKVAKNSAHPGYYWLAYTWSNLLPSCAFCNQRRHDRASLTEGAGPAAGKMDQFPLEIEQDRCMSHTGDLSIERPMLLNPCVDEPELHIAFDPNGSAIGLTERGQKTIEICHLNRKRLRDDRLEILDAVKQLIKIRQQAQVIGDQNVNDLADKALAKFTSDTAQYAGVARAIIRNPVLFV